MNKAKHLGSFLKADREPNVAANLKKRASNINVALSWMHIPQETKPAIAFCK